MVGERSAALRLEHFERAGRLIELPRPHRLAREARETIRLARTLWPKELAHLPMTNPHKEVILKRLKDLPLARE